MQICIGFGLDIKYGELLFEKAGYRLDDPDLLLAYRIIFIEHRKIGIYKCNEILGALSLSIPVRRTTKSLEHAVQAVGLASEAGRSVHVDAIMDRKCEASRFRSYLDIGIARNKSLPHNSNMQKQ